MCPLLVLLPLATNAMLHGKVTFDERSLMIGGERELFLSGAVHYPRLMPADWDRVFHLAREMGLNTIQTYVFWNVHEPLLADRGNASWSGWADLPAFIRKAQDYNLYVSLRIGPYVCGEYYFGGVPVWIRNFGDIKCFRCADSIWKAEMQRWVANVVDVVRPLLQPRGNIVMMQIENEYGGDQDYLDWAVDMANHLTEGEAVPWILCHDYSTCFATNNRNGTYKFRALCAMNGFWMEEHRKDPDQPSPKFIEDLRANSPGQPTMWTEDQGWFDQWGVGKRIRFSNDQLYGIARWIAFGGSYHNFYMLTGGNNYGLKSGGEVATAYAPDTVVSNLLLKHQPRYNYYKQFFHALQEHKAELLAMPIPVTKHLRALNGSSSTTDSSASLLPCTDTDPAHPGNLDASQRWDMYKSLLRVNFTGSPLCIDALLSPQSPALVPCNMSDLSQQWIWNDTSRTISCVVEAPCQAPQSQGKMCYRCLDAGGSGTSFNSWDCSGHRTENQLWIRHDGSQDLRPKINPKFCLSGSSVSSGGIELHEYGELAFLSNTGADALMFTYNGVGFVLAAESVALVDVSSMKVLTNTGDAVDPKNQEPLHTGAATASYWDVFQETLGYGAKRLDHQVELHEQLNLTENEVDYMWYSVPIPRSTSVESVKISTQGGGLAYPFIREDRLHILSVAMGLANTQVGPQSVKGIRQVTVNGQVNTGPWNHSWVLEGEEKAIFDPMSTGSVTWQGYDHQKHKNEPLMWHKAVFDIPKDADILDTNTSFALDLSSMWKGIAYVNGFNLGRYWMKAGDCRGACAPPVKNGHCYMHWKDCNKPTQTIYHIPSSVLKTKNNLVVLFEESKPESQRNPFGVKLLSSVAPPLAPLAPLASSTIVI
eukprot:TRINITY_DN51862_c0_g1_i1.p1 TRINITY_DN51862_c0_g1~~TRINITY_DN51862_c0_g1_i1.p1  ORF type:complete len:888 (+),score=109.52 TRINITY_DN51862_c0_g1_i1:39-2666(+)